jgi:hypothetical protein
MKLLIASLCLLAASANAQMGMGDLAYLAGPEAAPGGSGGYTTNVLFSDETIGDESEQVVFGGSGFVGATWTNGAAAISVTDLGYLLDDGVLHADQYVAVVRWSDKAVVADLTIPLASAPGLPWIWAGITPVTLEANTTYALVAEINELNPYLFQPTYTLTAGSAGSTVSGSTIGGLSASAGSVVYLTCNLRYYAP